MSAKAAGKLLKLYTFPMCPYCQRAKIVAQERGIPYEEVAVERPIPEWYKKINPLETVPTLELPDGRYVHESNLISQYFDNIVQPSGSLMGSTPYQRHRIEFFMTQFGDMVSACYGVLKDPANAEKRKFLEENVKYVDNIIAENQKKGGPFFCDDEFTMADVSFVPFLIRFYSVLSYYTGYDLFTSGPHVKALWQAALQRPSVAKTTHTAHEYIVFYSPNLPKDAFLLEAKGGPVLYGNEYCPFVDRARLACAAKGFKPFYKEISLPKQPEFYKYINFRETVPTLVTESGEYVHESQLIVQYVDHAVQGGLALLPRGDAEKEYAVSYFTTVVGYYVDAMYTLFGKTLNEEAKNEFVWAVKEVKKLYDAKPFGEGPFFGGATMNAGDIAFLPFLVRTKAWTPELFGGFNIFAEFPFLDTYLQAAQATDIAKSVFHTPEEYLVQGREYLARRSQQ